MHLSESFGSFQQGSFTILLVRGVVIEWVRAPIRDIVLYGLRSLLGVVNWVSPCLLMILAARMLPGPLDSSWGFPLLIDWWHRRLIIIVR